MKENKQNIKTLAGYDALKLFALGKGAGNQWVEDNPGCDIDFSGCDFVPYHKVQKRGHNKTVLDFTAYRLPNGCVKFANAVSGDGDVKFDDATFGNVIWVSQALRLEMVV